MKKWLKRLALLLAVSLLVPIVFVGGLAMSYYRIVGAKSGRLPVPVFPGVLGTYVDPFIGTGGYPWICALNSPAASLPFGMVRLGPDTASLLINKTTMNLSGYYYGDNKIIGFSHTRLMGAGVAEGGNFRVFPTLSKEKAGRDTPVYARFSHTDETAFPGYYAVRLPEENILAEMTATSHGGFHRYTFPANKAPRLLLDVTSALGKGYCKDGVLWILPNTREIEGSVRYFGDFSNRYGGLDLFFVARFSQPFAAFGAWNGAHLRPGVDGAAGTDIGARLDFAAKPEQQTIELRLALSCVSLANARLNLEQEMGNASFEDIFARARDAWEHRLRAIQVRGGTDKRRRIFYTALYRTFQMPTRFNDVNGEYRGFDKAIHTADGFHYYTDISLWDTFRTVHPLYNLIARTEQRDMMKSLVEMAKCGGSLPRWPAGCGYTGSMFGSPADMAITEAYLKGVREFDIETAYRFMRRTALEGLPPGMNCDQRDGLEWYLQYGYCPCDKMQESVACTLEYAWADHSLSLLAAALGKLEDAQRFARHAQSWRNLWNPQSRYFHPKDSAGKFSPDFKPGLFTYLDFQGKYTGAYVEGSAMQWRWAIPFDGDGLVATIGGPDTFARELEAYMEGVNPKLGALNPGPYYWHGNEPFFHAAYLFHHAGRPDLVQKWVRWILENKYDDTYVGLEGNDDGGTLSAWYVFSALGLYPIAGTNRYWIGAPLFDRADIKLGEGATLTIIAENNSPQNLYVQRLTLNDVTHGVDFLDHAEIAAGGTLRFEMGPAPVLNSVLPE